MREHYKTLPQRGRRWGFKPEPVCRDRNHIEKLQTTAKCSPILFIYNIFRRPVPYEHEKGRSVFPHSTFGWLAYERRETGNEYSQSEERGCRNAVILDKSEGK